MRLSTRSRYGTRMLLDLVLYGNDGPVRLAETANRLSVSVKYLEKLVRELQRAGYVASKRGPAGGHVVVKPAAEISVGEVVRVLEGEEALTRCVQVNESCPFESACPMHWVWGEASQAMFEKLDSISFSDLMEKAHREQLDCDFSRLGPEAELN